MYCLQYVKVVFNWVNKESQMPTANGTSFLDVRSPGGNFRENITTSRQTSSEGHSIRRGHSAFWKACEKTVARIGVRTSRL